MQGFEREQARFARSGGMRIARNSSSCRKQAPGIEFISGDVED